MARWGNADFKQLQDLQAKLNQLQQGDIAKFSEECAKELAARLLAKVIKRTPVGEYTGIVKFTTSEGKQVEFKSKATEGMMGGTLRRGWTAKSEREAELSATFGGGTGAKTYVDSLVVQKTGDLYTIEIVNPVHYASYVEFGHRTANHKGWVKGKFYLTISEQELETQSVGILEKKLMKYLGGVFNA